MYNGRSAVRCPARASNFSFLCEVHTHCVPFPYLPIRKIGVLSPGGKETGGTKFITHIQVVPMYWHCPRSLQLSLTAVRAGEIDRPLFLTSNQCTAFKKTFDWNAVVFCACEIIQLFYVVVRAVHKSHFSLDINETPNKWRPPERSCSDRDSCFWQDLYVFRPTIVTSYSNHSVLVLSKGQQTECYVYCQSPYMLSLAGQGKLHLFYLQTTLIADSRLHFCE